MKQWFVACACSAVMSFLIFLVLLHAHLVSDDWNSFLFLVCMEVIFAVVFDRFILRSRKHGRNKPHEENL